MICNFVILQPVKISWNIDQYGLKFTPQIKVYFRNFYFAFKLCLKYIKVVTPKWEQKK